MGRMMLLLYYFVMCMSVCLFAGNDKEDDDSAIVKSLQEKGKEEVVLPQDNALKDEKNKKVNKKEEIKNIVLPKESKSGPISRIKSQSSNPHDIIDFGPSPERKSDEPKKIVFLRSKSVSSAPIFGNLGQK